MRTSESALTSTAAKLLFALLLPIQSFKRHRDHSFQCIFGQELRPASPAFQGRIHLWQVLRPIPSDGHTRVHSFSRHHLAATSCKTKDITAVICSISTYSTFDFSSSAMMHDRSLSGSDNCRAVTVMLKIYALSQQREDSAYSHFCSQRLACQRIVVLSHERLVCRFLCVLLVLSRDLLQHFRYVASTAYVVDCNVEPMISHQALD